MTPETINFLTKGKGWFGTPDEFKKSWLYSYFTDLYGEMVFLPNLEFEFIKVTEDGYYIDEIYSKDSSSEYKAGSFIPISFIGNKKSSFDSFWRDMQNDGYFVAHYDPHEKVREKINSIVFFEDDNLPLSILNSNAEELNYIVLNVPKYSGPLRLDKRIISTDALKYRYKENELDTRGPYSFHMDCTPGVYYMIFNYFSNSKKIEGRELVIGERDLSTIELDQKGICRSGNIIKETKIEIKDGMVLFLNTYNPRFVHKVEKLKADQEVVLLSSYVHT